MHGILTIGCFRWTKGGQNLRLQGEKFFVLFLSSEQGSARVAQMMILHHASHFEISAHCNFPEADFPQYPIRMVEIVTKVFRLECKSQFVQEWEWARLQQSSVEHLILPHKCWILENPVWNSHRHADRSSSTTQKWGENGYMRSAWSEKPIQEDMRTPSWTPVQNCLLDTSFARKAEFHRKNICVSLVPGGG